MREVHAIEAARQLDGLPSPGGWINAVPASRDARSLAAGARTKLAVTVEGIVVETQATLQPPLLAWAEVRSIRLGATVGRSVLLFWIDVTAPMPFVEFAMADGRRFNFRFPMVFHEDFLRFAATLLDVARGQGATAPLVVLSDDLLYRVLRGGIGVALAAFPVAATVLVAFSGSLGRTLLVAAFAAVATWSAWYFIRNGRSRPVPVGDRAEDVLRLLRMRL